MLNIEGNLFWPRLVDYLLQERMFAEVVEYGRIDVFNDDPGT